MKPVWVKVDWDVPSTYSENTITVKPKFIQCVEELQQKDGIYLAEEYTRSENRVLSIGIKTTTPYQYVNTIGKFSYKRTLVEGENGIWVACPVYEWNYSEQRYEVRIPSLGVNQCGILEIECVTNEGLDVDKCKIKIRSSLLSEQEYELMEQELLSITEELLYKDNKSVGGEEGNSSLINLEAVKTLVQSLIEAIIEIEKAPAEKLMQVRKKINIDKLRKVDIQAFLEKELYPYREKVSALTTVRSLDISEHRKIKGALLEFHLICARNRDRETEMYRSILTQQQEIKAQKQNLSARNRKLAIYFSQKEHYLSVKLALLTNRQECWREILEQFDDLLESKLLGECDKEEWGDTHLFTYHTEYSQAFDIIEQLQRELRQNHIELKAFQRDLLHSPDLYEKWVFFKVLHYFSETMQFSPQSGNVMEEVLAYYAKHNKLKDLQIKLSISNSFHMVIGNEIRFNNNERPDIALGFYSHQLEGLAYLDAKYKPYSQMTKQLSKDLDKSAKRYRLMHSKGKTAFLVHPDKKLGSNFGAIKPHLDGHLMLKPGQDEELARYIKMVLHFHLKWDDFCPDCGEVTNTITDFGYKKHYSCEKCKSFWVQSMCWNKSHFRKQTLYKYLGLNYHKPTDHDWDVHCPQCNLTYDDNPNKGDFYV